MQAPRSLLSAAIAVLATIIMGASPASADLFVSSVNLDGRGAGVFRFDQTTGMLLNSFASGFSVLGIAIGPDDGNVYIATELLIFGTVVVFTQTGSAVTSFSLPGITLPAALAFGPDRNLYISDGASAVYRLNLTTRVLSRFATDSATTAYGHMTFGPDGNLYVSAVGSLGVAPAIVIFNGTTGTLIARIPFSLGSPAGLRFGPDGALYAIENIALPPPLIAIPGMVQRIDPATRAQTTFVPVGTLADAHDLAFGPDCNLYVVDSSDQVFRFDGKTGARLGVLTTVSGPSVLPGYMTFSSSCLNTAPLTPTSFLTRFYSQVLGRDPEPTGLAGWVNFLNANCNAQGFDAIARGFFDSLEFRTVKPQSLPGLVTLLYRTFLGREPEPAGLAGWAGLIRQARLTMALQGFIPSREFQSLLPDRTNRAAVTAVVTRLYREVLGREPEPAGLAGWVDFIVATGNLEAAATGFLGSQEFESHAQTARDYVTTLYRTFLNRDPEPAGLDGWESVLRTTLLQVIDAGFVPSQEFQGLVPQVCG